MNANHKWSGMEKSQDELISRYSKSGNYFNGLLAGFF